MIQLEIPGNGCLVLEHLVLDLNGTISLDGRLIGGVKERISHLRGSLSIQIVTADTRGHADALERELRVNVRKIQRGDESQQKLGIVRRLGARSTVAVGNGANDADMLREAALGICVLGTEGASIAALMNSDLVVPNIIVAFDLLIYPERLVATLRR